MALDELMEKCEPTQVRHVMQVIEPQFQRDFISLLPKEVCMADVKLLLLPCGDRFALIFPAKSSINYPRVNEEYTLNCTFY